MKVFYSIFFFVAIMFAIYLVSMYQVSDAEPQTSGIFENTTQNVSTAPAEVTMALGAISFIVKVGLAVVSLTMAVYIISEMVMKL